MATSETVVFEHPTIVKPVEKIDGETPTKQEEIPPSKDDGKKEQPKAEPFEGTEIKAIKPEEPIVDKEIEPPIVVVAPVEHTSKGVEVSIPDLAVLSPPDSAGEKQPEEKPAVEVVKNIPAEEPEIKPVENVLEEKPETKIVEHEPEEKPDAGSIPEEKPAVQLVENIPVEEKAVFIEPEEKSVTESLKIDSKEKPVQNEPVEKPAIDPVENEPAKIPAIEAVGNNLEEKLETGTVESTPDDKVAIYEEEKLAIKAVENEPKPVEVKVDESEVKIVEPNSLLECASQPVENMEVVPVKESEPEITKQPEDVPEAECKMVEKPEIVDVMNVVPPEQSHVVEEVVEKVEDKKPTEVEAEVPKDCPHVVEEVVEKVEDKPRENVAAEIVKDEVPQEHSHIVEKVVEKIEDVIGFDASQVAEKSIAGEQDSRDMELVKDVEADANKSETTKEVIDATKESSKDSDDTKTSRDLPVEEISVKPAQKQSGGIISKVKHSLVKVKKAIIGKSPSSKKLSPDAKVDEKVEKA